MRNKIGLAFLFLVVLTCISASVINLDHIKIETDETCFFNEEFYVYVIPLDKNNNITNTTSAFIEIQNNIIMNESFVLKDTEGIYKKSFIIPFQNISEFKISAKVYQNEKVVDDSIVVNIEEKTLINEIKNDGISYFNTVVNFIVENWLYFLLGFVTLIFIIIVLTIRHYTKR